MAQNKNASMSMSMDTVDRFCDACLWKRWDDKSPDIPCIGQIVDMVSAALRKQESGNSSNHFGYQEFMEKAKRSIILNENDCTDPNLDDEDADDDDDQLSALRSSFCPDCIWKENINNTTCNAKVNNMATAYSISRERAIDAVLMDCTTVTDHDHNGIPILALIAFIPSVVSFYIARKIIQPHKFEGNAYSLLEGDFKSYGVDPRAMIEYPPALLIEILSPLGMSNNSILMISDGQNKSIPERLSSDPTIGPLFQEIPQNIRTKVSDMMLAILSSVFIGNPVSTFSHFIAQVRFALGLGPSYLHARRKDDGRWETFCEDEKCFYELHNP